MLQNNFHSAAFAAPLQWIYSYL